MKTSSAVAVRAALSRLENPRLRQEKGRADNARQCSRRAGHTGFFLEFEFAQVAFPAVRQHHSP